MNCPLYFIIDWERWFENRATKELKRMSWFPLPNKHDGDGYRELIQDHPNGPAHYTCWVVIVGVASKCEPRGVLLRNGSDTPAVNPRESRGNPAVIPRSSRGHPAVNPRESRGTAAVKCSPHNVMSLERKTGVPAELFREAIPRLIEIGWLGVSDWNDDCNEIPRSTRGNPAVIPRSSRGRMEWNGIERERESVDPDQDITDEQLDAFRGMDVTDEQLDVFRGLKATGKFGALTIEHVMLVMREYPKAKLAEMWQEIAAEAKGVVGQIGSAMPWLRKAVSALESRNVKKEGAGNVDVAPESRPTFRLTEGEDSED